MEKELVKIYIVAGVVIKQDNKYLLVQESMPSQYGLSLGIPEYQLDFSPFIKEWER